MANAPVTTMGLSKRARWIIFVILGLVAFTIIYPLFFLALTAVRTNEDYLRDPFGWPDELTLQAFRVLMEAYNVDRAFMNSLMVTSIGLVLTMGIATLAAYGLAKYHVPGARYINAAFISVMLIPGPVLIIPMYLLLARLQLVGEFQGLILVYVATGLPFNVFFLTLAFRSIPREVMEAADVDGAGFLRTFRSIVLPMGIPAIATASVMHFLGMWNELIFAFILLPDNEKMLLTPTLARIGGKFVTDQTLVSAGLLVTASVPILLLMFASRFIMQGIAAGISR